MLLACYSHKHISYRIRTIIRKAILKRGANPHVEGRKRRTAKTIAMKRSAYSGNKKSYREIVDLLAEAEKNYKTEKSNG